MKRVLRISLILALINLVSCGEQQKDDLDSKKKLLSEKKTELRSLQKEIDELSSDILKLNPPKEKEAVTVETMKMENKEFRRFVDLQGKIEADDVVNVSSEMGGRILSIKVKEGQYVKRGQLIATTDMSTLENQIAEIQTSLSLAQTVFERQEKLWNQNIGSEIQYLQAKTNKESLEKSLKTLKSQISKKNIYAPISGVIDQEFMKQGETSSPGMPIVQILNTSNVKIVTDVQENFLGTLNRGDLVEIYFPAIDKTIEKKITMMGRTIDQANRTFKIEIATSSLNGQLKPNLLAEVRINDYTLEDALVIPLSAIQQEVNGKKFVYVAKSENGQKRAHKAYIELGESTVGETVISSGISAGDILIVEGGKNLSNGDLVSYNS